jgi:hypothetical protein
MRDEYCGSCETTRRLLREREGKYRVAKVLGISSPDGPRYVLEIERVQETDNGLVVQVIIPKHPL